MKKVLLSLAVVLVMAFGTVKPAHAAYPIAALFLDLPVFVAYDVAPVVGLTYLIASGYDPWTPNFSVVDRTYPEQHHNF